MTSIIFRRTIYGLLTLLSALILLGLLYNMLAGHAPLLLLVSILFLFSLIVPWMVIGFWNAMIGLVIYQFCKEPLTYIFPQSMLNVAEEIHSSTAILLCIRNETPQRLVRNLEIMLSDLQTSGVGQHFTVYILSDTNDAAMVLDESASFARLQNQWSERIAMHYRRRTDNEGYKAGNIADFCQSFGHLHDFALVLDADSFMSGSAIVRLVRLMQANPRLGILQGLVMGLPATSPFSRLFQYGMRLGMRSYTMGSAWWQGDYGPFWGHNALLRLAPFMQHCHLPELPGARHILSHDLVEAVLMRRAGYEVRIYAQEDLSWEENPPSLSEYIRRDLRWCEGNLQYIHLLRLPHLKLLSRLQLLLAIFMFLGSPAWIVLILMGTIATGLYPDWAASVGQNALAVFLLLCLVMWYLPKFAGALNVLLKSSERKRFGGFWRFSGSLCVETLFSVLMTPITWLNHSMLIAALVLGKKGGWSGQARDDHTISWRQAIQQFWPHTLLGMVIFYIFYTYYPASLWVVLILAGGLLLAIPFAIVTSQPVLGRLMIRHRLLSLPEEITPSEALLHLQLPALQKSSSLAEPWS